MSTTDQLRNAVTPAKPQEADPKKAPLWQLPFWNI